jgi:hypothetical protein
MSLFNAFIELILAIVELFANSSPGKAENRGVAANLVSIRLQFNGTERCWGRLGVREKPRPLSWGRCRSLALIGVMAVFSRGPTTFVCRWWLGFM